MIKQMTWAQMQEHPLVGDNTAFWELSILDILTIFDMIGDNKYHGFVRIVEQPYMITVEID